MDTKLDTKRLGVLTAAGLVVATVCAGIAFAVSGGGGDGRPERDTVPVGQLVEVPTSSTPTSSSESQVVVADPIPKDTTVNEPAPKPAPQTVQAPAPQIAENNGPATEAPAEPTFTHPPYEPTEPGDTAPAPPPPAPCYVDENGHDICP